MFEPFGPYQAALTAQDLLPWHHASARADQFSVSLFGLRVTNEPGERIRRQIAMAMKCLRGTAGLQLFASRRWLGTTTSARLIAVGSAMGELANQWRTTNEIFEAVGASGNAALIWEDVAFYRGGKVLLWTCTHEKEAMIYADDGQLRSWGLEAKPAILPRIDAERLAEEAEKDILYQVAHSN